MSMFWYTDMCSPESCSHQFNIQLQVGQPDHSCVWIHIHVSAGVLLLSIRYFVASRPVWSPTHLQHVYVSGEILYSWTEYPISDRPLQPLPCFNMIVLFPPESCSHELSTVLVVHSHHAHVLIHGYLFAGILPSPIEYSVAGQLFQLIPYLNTYTCVRWSPALVNRLFSHESASPPHIETHVHVSGGTLYSRAEYRLAARPLRPLHVSK